MSTSTHRVNAHGVPVVVAAVPTAALVKDAVSAAPSKRNTLLVHAADAVSLVPVLYSAAESRSLPTLPLPRFPPSLAERTCRPFLNSECRCDSCCRKRCCRSATAALLAHAISAPGLPAVTLQARNSASTGASAAQGSSSKPNKPFPAMLLMPFNLLLTLFHQLQDSVLQLLWPFQPFHCSCRSWNCPLSISASSSVGILRVVFTAMVCHSLAGALPIQPKSAVLEFTSLPLVSALFSSMWLLLLTRLQYCKEVRVKGNVTSQSAVDQVLKAASIGSASFEVVEGDLNTDAFANLSLSAALNEAESRAHTFLASQVFKERLNLSNVIQESSVLQPAVSAAPKQIVSSGRSRFIETAKALVAANILSKPVASPLQAWINAQVPGAATPAESIALGRAAHDILYDACSFREELREFYAESGAYFLSAPEKPQPASNSTAAVERERFVLKAKELIANGSLPKNVITPLGAWVEAQTVGSPSALLQLLTDRSLQELGDAIAAAQLSRLSTLRQTTFPMASWWRPSCVRYRHFGVHHVISSKANVNILILDTQSYQDKKNPSSTDIRKKDIGLYAMTYGGVYVASVALQSSFAGVVRALTEADAFNGPSVIIAYAPRVVPPAVSGNGVLVKGSAGLAATAALAALKETKQAVDEGYWPLYRWSPSTKSSGDAKFSLDSERCAESLKPSWSPSLAIAASVEAELRENVETKIQESYQALIANLNSTPVLILYGSDGGAAKNAANRLAAEAKQRGLKPKVSVMDEYAVEDFVSHEHVVFVVSTAGQGEFPGNSRETWKALQGLKKGGDVDFGKMRYAVFAMGDSHYWPLPEDAHYFCKSGKDLDAKLEVLGAPRLVQVGLGNDRDADGWMTGYRSFTADWSCCLVPSDDAIKESSNFLRGTIAPGLLDTSTGALCELDTRITKFHGIYQQDDRDIREARLRAGLEAAYSFMVRVRVPGGVATPAQWAAIDDVADKLANGTIKLTTRQAFQFHGIVKSKLKNSNVHRQVQEFTKKFSDHLTPNTNAYHEIWLDKKMVVTSEDVEPIYGKTYLPRKFKVAVAVPPHNDVECDNLIGFNVTVGGGMGMTHGMKTTYPRLGDLLGFCTVEQAVEVGEKVVTTQRDSEIVPTVSTPVSSTPLMTVESTGSVAKSKAVSDTNSNLPDHTHSSPTVTDMDGAKNGRVKDESTRLMKTGLRALADDFIRRDYEMENGNLSGLRQNSMACVALPTCALAMAESERYLPDLVGKIEDVLEVNGLRENAITIRMTGCPNGCARPQMAEIAFIGKAPGTYNMYLGGGHSGERLNKIYRENVTEPEIIELLTPLIQDYAKTKIDGEHFGDFVIRKNYIKATTAGKNFHDV
ncbi:hypothetical protein BCR33DRAFT_761786 [Rhizoclosmatium globosum]|uniref:assimilatory sulfite reductase (NADPH) n=1 Tax=Rhizoclosmatium globosum TaxID=329046 RepID=A0A1Y2D0L6_9FUNG|nr:hypothetical protein BCR33DRAFT_761786 [Rhizoclosmatium globosum]|eukprot:ORY52674.1 hypothetical protein BCR33DRAFT_761786 [Rhizoclosmatium globosum]